MPSDAQHSTAHAQRINSSACHRGWMSHETNGSAIQHMCTASKYSQPSHGDYCYMGGNVSYLALGAPLRLTSRRLLTRRTKFTSERRRITLRDLQPPLGRECPPFIGMIIFGYWVLAPYRPPRLSKIGVMDLDQKRVFGFQMIISYFRYDTQIWFSADWKCLCMDAKMHTLHTTHTFPITLK